MWTRALQLIQVFDGRSQERESAGRRSMVKLDKARMRQRGRELRALLNEWDPIGIVGPDGPKDEYDCLLWPLMRMLENGVGAEGLTSFLTAQLQEHFGMDPGPSSPDDFAARVKNWFEAGWKDSQV